MPSNSFDNNLSEEFINRLMDIIRPLVEVADAYDLNLLDGEATKFWGDDNQFQNHTLPQKVELVVDKHNKKYITLRDCIRARAVLKEYGK